MTTGAEISQQLDDLIRRAATIGYWRNIVRTPDGIAALQKKGITREGANMWLTGQEEIITSQIEILCTKPGQQEKAFLEINRRVTEIEDGDISGFPTFDP